MVKFFNILIIVFTMLGSVYSQPKTNIEQVYGLIEKSVTGILTGKVEKKDKVYVEFSSPDSYSILKSSLIEKTGASASVNPQKENSGFVLTYTIEEARIKYSDPFTQSFLGRNYVEREVTLKGFSALNRPAEPVTIGRFSYSEKDTVEYRQLKELANTAYPFTNPEIPQEPFFSSILEPVIAVGVAVTTIYLLFTVRSK